MVLMIYVGIMFLAQAMARAPRVIHLEIEGRTRVS